MHLAPSATVSTGALSAVSLVPVFIGSDGPYDSCGASWTSVDTSVSALGDCYTSGRIAPLPLVAQGILLVPKGIDYLDGPSTAIAGSSYRPDSVPKDDHDRRILTGMWSTMCGLLGKGVLVNSTKGSAYQLPKATDRFASAEACPSDVGGPACVDKVRQQDSGDVHLAYYLLVWSSAHFLSGRASIFLDFSTWVRFYFPGGPISTERRVQFGRPDVDLYASRENEHCCLFLSMRDMGTPLGTNALVASAPYQRPGTLHYVFPPGDLIPATMQRVR